MAYDIIDYGKLVDEAMHVIVANVLKIVQNKGLPGNHHFFISFITKYPGVKLSKTLLNKYPREMTIVLQYQFQDLKVDAKGFSIVLSFNGVKEGIYIPFASITTFADPSVQFGLQFRGVEFYEDSDQNEVRYELELEDDTPADKAAPKGKGKAKKSADAKKDTNVVSLEQFRSKKDK